MRHFSEEEKQRAVNLYFNEGLTTQETVNKLGYPTRQNLERWLSCFWQNRNQPQWRLRSLPVGV